MVPPAIPSRQACLGPNFLLPSRVVPGEEAGLVTRGSCQPLVWWPVGRARPGACPSRDEGSSILETWPARGAWSDPQPCRPPWMSVPVIVDVRSWGFLLFLPSSGSEYGGKFHP